MAFAATGNSGIRRLGFASRFIVFLAIFSFALQSYIAQTHIHGISQDAGAAVKIVAGAAPVKGKGPLNNSPVDCPFCQTAALAGFVLTPSMPLLYLSLAWAKAFMPPLTASAISATAAHDWQSRAPPQA
jgi:hypothetical protein